jgi:hypothetical protein
LRLCLDFGLGQLRTSVLLGDTCSTEEKESPFLGDFIKNIESFNITLLWSFCCYYFPSTINIQQRCCFVFKPHSGRIFIVKKWFALI